MPFNEKIRGPLPKFSHQSTKLPFVLLVGNHSSGKSSFINYVSGRNVQTAGVAPTDDCFTVIAPGQEDVDQDGPALIGNTEFGFSGLRQFGPTLIHHTQLKVRSDLHTSSFMLVDSPGMIDTPMGSNINNISAASMAGGGNSSSSSSSSNSMNSSDSSMDRGYDFPSVVRWLAERADVVLLFFDPDKPGTTGETLNVLLHSLGGMDHKLLIVLNKADQFNKIHDFARAYGSLCWNLSKVIHRKDLPRIFTMCLPMKDQQDGTSTNTTTTKSSSSSSSMVDGGLSDLHQTRDDVVAEVMKAPKRRVDNIITHLNDSVHLLLMHAKISQDVQTRYAKLVWNHRLQELGSLTTGAGLTMLGLYTSLPMEFTGGLLSMTIVGVGGLRLFNNTKISEAEAQLITSEELSISFQRTYSREIADADEFVANVWQRIREPLKMSLKSFGLANFPSIGSSEMYELQRILDEEIPRLRRNASPPYF